MVGYAVSDPSYSIAYVYPGSGMVNEAFAASMAKTTSRHSPGSLVRYSSPRPFDARNKSVQHWLTHDDTDWLLFADTDMDWEPEAFDYLYETAEEVGPAVVGGLCFSYDYNRGLLKPTIYFRNDELENWSSSPFYPYDDVFRVDATGAAFLLIHREVAEAVFELYDRPFWDVVLPTGEPQGNDITFCARAGEAGYMVYVDSRAKINHVKPLLLGEDQHKAWKDANGIR